MAESRNKYDEEYDRKSDIQAFENTKTGVKGLVDAGITKVPRIFIQEVQQNEEQVSNLSIPVIDFQGLENDDILAGRRNEVISSVNDACEEWGFFQIINHGIPASVMEKMIEGIRQFHELDPELKKRYYSRDYLSGKVVYNSNYFLYDAPAADWRDTVYFTMTPINPIDPKEFPDVCRDITIEYAERMNKLGRTVLEVLSEALGLKRNNLIDMGCVKRPIILGHYYPACPEPERTLGITAHSDSTFFTVVLQDQLGGLQVLYQNDQWVDVTPEPGSLLINIGNLIQVLSNEKYLSVTHRVVAKHAGPRISVGSFFTAGADSLPSDKLLGPIKQLLSQENPPKYRAFTLQEYTESCRSKWRDGTSPFLHFKL